MAWGHESSHGGHENRGQSHIASVTDGTARQLRLNGRRSSVGLGPIWAWLERGMGAAQDRGAEVVDRSPAGRGRCTRSGSDANWASFMRRKTIQIKLLEMWIAGLHSINER